MIAAAALAIFSMAQDSAAQLHPENNPHVPYYCHVGMWPEKGSAGPIELLCSWNCGVAPDLMSERDMVKAGMDPRVAKFESAHRRDQVRQWHRECDAKAATK